MGESAHLDPAAIERLQRLGGAGFVVKMIDLFVGYAGEKLTAAKRALTAADFKGVADAVHPVKSSAGNVGAKRVQELASQIEALARQSQGDALPALLAELDVAFAASRGELEAVKQSLGSAPGEAK